MNYSIWLLIFIFIGYFIVTDASVARLFVLIGNYIRLKYVRLKWYLLHLPDNPFVRLRVELNSYKMAKELQKELDEKNK